MHYVNALKSFSILLKDFFLFKDYFERPSEQLFLSLKYCVSFLIATVTDYHKLDRLKQHTFIPHQVQRPISKIGFTGLKSRCR